MRSEGLPNRYEGLEFCVHGLVLKAGAHHVINVTKDGSIRRFCGSKPRLLELRFGVPEMRGRGVKLRIGLKDQTRKATRKKPRECRQLPYVT